MVSICCGAKLMDFESPICSECKEHCDVENNITNANLNDLILTLESLMKKLNDAGIDDIDELPIAIKDIRQIQKQIYTIGRYIQLEL